MRSSAVSDYRKIIMKQKVRDKLSRLSVIIRKPPIATLLAMVTALTSIFIGGNMLFDPVSFMDAPEYDAATMLVSPYVWGVIFVGLATWLLIYTLRNKDGRKTSHLAVSMLCVLYSALAFLVGLSSLHSTSPSAPAWQYLGIAAYCLVTQFALREESNDALAKSSASNV